MLRNNSSKLFRIVCLRCLSQTSSVQKEIRISVEGNKTTIEGVYVKDDKRKVLNLEGLGDPRTSDPLIRTGLQVKHTDVLILSQFIRPDGTVLPNHVTGLTVRSQFHIEMLIDRAKRAGLLPIRITSEGKHEYFDGGKHKFNVYYDSDTIGLPKLKKKAFEYEPPE